MKVGMTLPQRRDDATFAPWPELARLAKLADAEGIDSLWVADHFFYRDPAEGVEIGLHEAFTVLTAVAAITERVEVGPLVACTSFRSAGMLAKVANTLDIVSGGRLILGLGCGWHEAEYTAFDYPFDHRVGRFEEVLSVVRPLLRGERVTVEGRWTKLDDAVILPPPQRDIPLLIASNGPRMLDITARLADAWQGAWFGMPDEEYRAQRASLAAACDAAGRTDPLKIFIGVDATNEESESPHIAIDASAIAETLAAWDEEGADHVQVRVYPGSNANFETAVEGIKRFRG